MAIKWRPVGSGEVAFVGVAGYVATLYRSTIHGPVSASFCSKKDTWDRNRGIELARGRDGHYCSAGYRDDPQAVLFYIVLSGAPAPEAVKTAILDAVHRTCTKAKRGPVHTPMWTQAQLKAMGANTTVS